MLKMSDEEIRKQTERANSLVFPDEEDDDADEEELRGIRLYPSKNSASEDEEDDEGTEGNDDHAQKLTSPRKLFSEAQPTRARTTTAKNPRKEEEHEKNLSDADLRDAFARDASEKDIDDEDDEDDSLLPPKSIPAMPLSGEIDEATTAHTPPRHDDDVVVPEDPLSLELAPLAKQVVSAKPPPPGQTPQLVTKTSDNKKPKLVEAKPVERKPVEAKPVERKPAKPLPRKSTEKSRLEKDAQRTPPPAAPQPTGKKSEKEKPQAKPTIDKTVGPSDRAKDAQRKKAREEEEKLKKHPERLRQHMNWDSTTRHGLELKYGEWKDPFVVIDKPSGEHFFLRNCSFFGS